MNYFRLFVLILCFSFLLSQNAVLAGSSVEPLAALGQSLEGVIVLKSEMDESVVRQKVGEGKPGDVFFIQPGSSWTLKDTLVIPEGVSLIGSHPGGGKASNHPTFIKGFNGDLVHLYRFTTLHGITFHGNKDTFDGHGIVTPDNGNREIRMTRVEVRNNRGHGYYMKGYHYYSEFNFCTFDRNDGYGVVYGQVRSHHTDNMWRSCHIGWNGKGGVAFYGMEASSVWENCEFWHNGGAAFDNFMIVKKTGHGKPIGPDPRKGADALVIRNSVIRNHPGPVWLQREGRSQGIVFEDCRLKHNGDPKDSAFTKDSGQTAAEYMGLTEPVSGLFHAENGQLTVELRGGYAWNNGKYIYTASPNSVPGGRITLSGGSKMGAFKGGIYAPNGYATILDLSLLEKDVEIMVDQGIGLNPLTGEIEKLGSQAN